MINLPFEHSIQDCTKLKAFCSCPRKYFYEFILGWRLNRPEHDLHFGIAIHKAFEKIYEIWKEEGPGYDEKRILAGYADFLKTYREEFSADTDEEYKPKTPDNVLEMLLKYAQTYQGSDDFSVDFTEVAGSVIVGENSVGDPRLLSFRLDTFCRDSKGKRFILEHKTSKWSSFFWTKSFDFAMQIGMGQHVLDMCFPEEEVFGVVVNGLLFRSAPRFKKNGEPYANNGTGNEVIRLPKQWGSAKKEDWLFSINKLFDQIEVETAELLSCEEDDTYLAAFPKRETSCFEFNRLCPYQDLCAAIQNPLRLGAEAPIGFHIVHWNPLTVESDSKYAAALTGDTLCPVAPQQQDLPLQS